MKVESIKSVIRSLEEEWGLGEVTTSHLAVRVFNGDRIKARNHLKAMAEDGDLIEIKAKGNKELRWSVK